LIRALILAAVLTQAQPELIERTLALVGGQPITLGDTRAATALGLLDANLSPAGDVLNRLVDRELILREVQRYGPAAPAESAVEARLAEIRMRFADPAALTRVLTDTGFTEVRLRAWVRDDLRAQAYLAQRFASATPATRMDSINDWLSDLRRRTDVVILPQ
jgi:hypothetical protein